MFKHYKDLCDVVSLLVYCPGDRSYLLNKEVNGEYWIPSCKTKNNCWNMTAQKMNIEMFGSHASVCQPLQVLKIWLPDHHSAAVYHAVYKAAVKSDVRKRVKVKSTGCAKNLQWVTSVEMDRLRVHSYLRSPEIAVFTAMAVGDQCKDEVNQELKSGMLVEVCEETTIVGPDCAGSLVGAALQHCQLVVAVYKKDDQIRLYREFTELVYPAQYMSSRLFGQLMLDLGWQYLQCPALFRAADVANRRGLSFHELLVWTAAIEPTTQHSGAAAEIRCKYIFRYFDSDHDQKLEYTEFKELVAAARTARNVPIDALSVARDADNIYRQLGMQPNTQLSMADYMRGISEMLLRGTSTMLRAPRGIAGYLLDLQRMKHSQGPGVVEPQLRVGSPPQTSKSTQTRGAAAAPRDSGARRQKPFSASTRSPGGDYSVAAYTVRVRRHAPNEMELAAFDGTVVDGYQTLFTVTIDAQRYLPAEEEISRHGGMFVEDAVTPSTADVLGSPSLAVLGPLSAPVEALAAVHHFATPILAVNMKRQSIATVSSGTGGSGKPAWAWACRTEEANMGSLLIKLADAVAPICASEPRMIRMKSPVYAVGDLHGNLSTLLNMEAAFWPMGPAMAPARFLFLGDYVDRGPYGTELVAYLLAAKLQRPNGVIMIRGNHETRDIQKMFTFHTECINKYGQTEGARVWAAINHVFDALPLAAVVDDKVFCCHGGIPPPWLCPLISAIDKVPVPLPRPAEQSSLAWELLWNDPIKPNKTTATMAMELAANEGFAANAKRGTGHVFDQSALDRFLLANQLSHVLRAHEVHHSGFMCQLRGRLVSVFSSSRYCGGGNDAGAALLEDGQLRLLRVLEE